MKRRRKKVRKGFSNKKRLTIIGISLIVIFAVFFVIMGMGGLFNSSVIDQEETITQPVDKESGKVNALIVGVDRGGTLTDTIMVASYNLDTNSVNILSVPRDTRMYIGNRYQKINSAHSLTKDGKKKGINGTIEAVTRLTGIPINYYVEFTFNAFRETIDALGGVEFDVPQNMNYDDPAQDLHIHLQKGMQLLDGDKAEQFVRFRRYPMGDIDRVSAQQNFIKALAEQKLNASIIPKLPDLYKALEKNLTTNISGADILRYMPNLMELSSENVNMHALPGVSNGTDYGSSYWIADMTQLAELIQNTFGYDASEITIHSADGNSKSKDQKNTVKPSEKATEKPSAKETATPKPTSKATQKPTSKPDDKSTEKPSQATEKPSDKATPKPTQKPVTGDDDKAEATTQKPTAKPTQKPAASSAPAVTQKPAATPAPTQKPAAEKNDSPAEAGTKRPAANQ